MEEKKMTIQQVLEVTRDILGDIQVPVRYNRQIGEPIAYAADNLMKCIETIRAQGVQKEEEPAIREEEI